MAETLERRRELLEPKVLPKIIEPIRQSPETERPHDGLVRSLKAQGLEGLIAKRRNSEYEPGEAQARGRRCVAIRARIFDRRIHDWRCDVRWYAGFSKGEISSMWPARVTAPHPNRAELLVKFKPLQIPDCPFSDLPEKRPGR